MAVQTTDNYRIRPVEASHVVDLIRIGAATDLSPWTAQSYLDEIKNPASIMLRLVGQDNLTVGFIVGRLVAGGEIKARTDAEIYNIAVHTSMQRLGCGQMLFDAFLLGCRDKDAQNIWLEVRNSNQKAIGFYEKNGFERVQSRNNFYENPREHALLMRLILE